MAFSKTPEQDTHSSFRIPPRGNQTLQSHVTSFSDRIGLKYVNCFPVIRESKTSDPKVVLKKAPKVLSVTWQFPEGSDPGITSYDMDTNVFVYKGQIFQKNENDTTVSLLYDAGDDMLLSCQRAIDYSGAGEIIVIGLVKKRDNEYVYSYSYNVTTNTYAVGTNAVAGNDSYAMVRDLFFDGYHVVAVTGPELKINRVYVSLPGQYNEFYTSTDFFVPEADPDDILDIQKHKNYLCVIGTKTIEFYYNSGNELGSPFSRQDQYIIRMGGARNVVNKTKLISVCLGDDIYFLGAKDNQIGIYVIRGFQATKLSDDYIDYLLNDESRLNNLTSSSVVELGFADIFGNIKLVAQFRNNSGNIRNCFVFNERDMVWWEWAKSDNTGFITDAVGLSSNISGKPLFLDGQLLGTGRKATYSVIIPIDTQSYVYLPAGNFLETISITDTYTSQVIPA